MFALIFDRHFAAVHRYLHRRAGRDLADELAAETFALAFERRASCRASGSVLPWLYGIATNLLLASRRAERRQLRAYGRSGVDRWAAYEDEAAARADGSALDASLARALAAMRPRERDALLLYALAGLSYEEISLALDVPLATVRTWLSAEVAPCEQVPGAAVAAAGAVPVAARSTGADVVASKGPQIVGTSDAHPDVQAEVGHELHRPAVRLRFITDAVGMQRLVDDGVERTRSARIRFATRKQSLHVRADAGCEVQPARAFATSRIRAVWLLQVGPSPWAARTESQSAGFQHASASDRGRPNSFIVL